MRVTPARIAELELTGITHGGEAVGRLPEGKACFVPFAIPGERVRVEIVEERARWARARLLEVLSPSPDRVAPPCPLFGPGACGGCHLQHVAPARQADLKRRVVVEQLERVGRIPAPPVEATVHVAETAYRTSARFAVDREGRLGFRAAGSNDVVPVARCLVLAPHTQAARTAAGDDWRDVQEVTVRAGADGGSVVLVHEDGATTVRGDEALHMRVGGFDFRVSPTSFFQPSLAGAEVLLRLVREAAGVAPREPAWDLYAGVGLFARALAADGARLTAVEAHPAAASDARVNLPADVRVITARAEDAVSRLRHEGLHGTQAAPRGVVVLDPPRKGAGAQVTRAVAAARPRVIVYVSCDPAALARDARTLADAGYALARAVPVDQFAHTHHVETVATFTPATFTPT